MDIAPKLFIIIACINSFLVSSLNVDFPSKLPLVFKHAFYILVVMCALYIGIRRDYYLPFLSKTVFPSTVVKESYPLDSDMDVVIATAPNAQVVYWATDGGQNFYATPKDAYARLDNTGVTLANSMGHAVLRVKKPVSYMVQKWFRWQVLEPHVHYRVIESNGMYGPVQTVFLKMDD